MSRSSKFFTCFVCKKQSTKSWNFSDAPERILMKKRELETILCDIFGVTQPDFEEAVNEFPFKSQPSHCRSCAPYFRDIELWENDQNKLEKEVHRLQKTLLVKLKGLADAVEGRKRCADGLRNAIIRSEEDGSEDEDIPAGILSIRRCIIECNSNFQCCVCFH
jgi:hypothetical protein